MGKYLDIARKFEERQREDTASYPILRIRDQRAAGTVEPQCFDIDSLWLIDTHPELWAEMRNLDGILSELEKEKAEESLCHQALERLVAAVWKAWGLYQRERRHSKLQ